MKKHLIVIFISLISSAAICGEKFVVCGDDHFPPYSFTKDSKTVGIDVDLVQHVMKKANVDITIKLLSWKRLLVDLRSGKCDFAFSLFQTPERQTYSDYLAPVHMSSLAILVNKSSKLVMKDLNDLFNHKLLIPLGFSISKEFDLARKAKQIKVSEVRDMRNAIVQVSRGRADGYINNSEFVRYYMVSSDLPEKIKSSAKFIQTSIVKSRPAFLVVSKKSKMAKQAETLSKIKKELENILADGRYKIFSEKYLQ